MTAFITVILREALIQDFLKMLLLFSFDIGPESKRRHFKKWQAYAVPSLLLACLCWRAPDRSVYLQIVISSIDDGGSAATHPGPDLDPNNSCMWVSRLCELYDDDPWIKMSSYIRKRSILNLISFVLAWNAWHASCLLWSMNFCFSSPLILLDLRDLFFIVLNLVYEYYHVLLPSFVIYMKYI